MDRSKKVSEFTPVTSVANSDLLLLVTNTAGNSVTSNITSLNFKKIPKYPTPANSTVLVIDEGVVFRDDNYLYVSTANNVVKRVALGTF